MDIRLDIELDSDISEDKVIIRCNKMTKDIYELQNMISDFISKKQKIVFYKNNIEYYIDLSDILFFETEDNCINAHTRDNIYQVKYKLYELENILSNNFVRISKSTILNIDEIHSITKNLTSSSVVEFKNSHKKTYISRRYYKDLRYKLSEKRL